MMRQPKARLVCLFLACTFIAGCSTKITYNFLDWWLGWVVRDYVTLDRGQRRQVKADIDRFHRWHRSQQLPAYAEALEQLRADLSQTDITSTQLEGYGTRLTEFWDTALDQLTAPVTTLAASLSDQQVQQVYENLERQRLEFLEEYAIPDAAKRRKKRTERVQDIVQSWLGRLNGEQKQLILDWSNALKPTAELSGEFRLQWQEELKAVLPHRVQPQFLAQNIKMLMFYPEEKWPRAYRETIAYNQQLTYDLLSRLNRSLSVKQQQKRNRTIQRYIDDFRELAGRYEDKG